MQSHNLTRNHREDEDSTVIRTGLLHVKAAGLPVCAALAGTLLVAGCSSGGSTAKDPAKVSASSAAQLLDRALKEQASGKTDEAKRDYEALVAKDPKNKLGYYNLGLIAQLAGDDGTASSNYAKTLDIDPKYDPALYNLAIVTDKKGDTKGAEALYRRAIASNPKDANAHFNLGLLLQRSGKMREAVAEINKAIALNPSLKRPLPAMSSVATPTTQP